MTPLSIAQSQAVEFMSQEIVGVLPSLHLLLQTSTWIQMDSSFIGLKITILATATKSVYSAWTVIKL